jgi:hypothetical protein
MWFATAMVAWADEPYTKERDRLVRDIVAEVRATAGETGPPETSGTRSEPSR